MLLPCYCPAHVPTTLNYLISSAAAIEKVFSYVLNPNKYIVCGKVIVIVKMRTRAQVTILCYTYDYVM